MKAFVPCFWAASRATDILLNAIVLVLYNQVVDGVYWSCHHVVQRKTSFILIPRTESVHRNGCRDHQGILHSRYDDAKPVVNSAL